MFLSHFSTAHCYEDLLTTLKSKISRLHELTKASTYYEFFNLSEGCSDSDIKKSFRKLRKSLPPGNLTKEQFEELLMNGYSVLSNYRKAYDNFLKDSKFIYISEPGNFRNYFIVILIAAVCFVVFVDFVTYAFKYLKYMENMSNYKKEKKEEKGKSPGNKRREHPKAPVMMLKRIFQRNQ